VAGLLPLCHFGPTYFDPESVRSIEIRVAFRGHYEHSLDAKNRLSVPKPFRAALSDGLVLLKWLDPCVAVYTPDAFQKFTDRVLEEHSPLSAQHRELSRFFLSNAFDAELDSAGRVILGAPLLEHAGIEKDVVVAGTAAKLEIWARDRWEAEQAALHDKALKVAEGLGHPS
jgi:MraZ protein